jgi:hypothetical protein
MRNKSKTIARFFSLEHLKEKVRSRSTHHSPCFNYAQETSGRTRNHSAANVATHLVLEQIQLRSSQSRQVITSSVQKPQTENIFSPSASSPAEAGSSSSSGSSLTTFFGVFGVLTFFTGVSPSAAAFAPRFLAGVGLGVPASGVAEPAPGPAWAVIFFWILAQALLAEAGLVKPARPASFL